MGGEWNFVFDTSKKDSFDLNLYRELLIKLKKEFQFQSNQKKTIPYFPPKGHHVYWCPLDETPPRDNIFARFTFKCEVVGVGSPSHPRDCTPVWNLYWDPFEAKATPCFMSARCAPPYPSIEVQKRLVDAFPEHFDIDLGDGLMGFGSWLGYKPGRGLIPRLCDNYNISNFQGVCNCMHCKDFKEDYEDLG